MSNVLILGALPKDEERRILYETIASVCGKYSKNISSPIDTANFKGTEKERYERAFQTVKNADFIIGEQSEPSTGQGMEIREAIILNKPLLVVAKEGSKISGLVKTCPILKEIIYYDSLEDLKLKLDKSLRKYI